MKKLIFILFFVTTISVAFAAGEILKNFTVSADSEVANIEWQTNSEVNVVRFEIERSTNAGFKTIGSQKANGKPSSYKFTDSDSFNKITQNELQASNTATYRLKIVYSSAEAPTYSDEKIATRSMNSVRRTLGMIKEMFK